MEDLISVLLHSVNQVHIFHLQTTSFAEHKALGGYYNSIGDITDELAEAYQGKYGILKYKNVSKIEQYESKEQIIEYFSKIVKFIEKARPIKDPFIDNIVQEIEKLIYQTLYKLKYLN
jgi:DNA-binding ferritin-like protein